MGVKFIVLNCLRERKRKRKEEVYCDEIEMEKGYLVCLKDFFLKISGRKREMKVKMRRHKIASCTYSSLVTCTKHYATKMVEPRNPCPGFGFEVDRMHSAGLICYHDILLRCEPNMTKGFSLRGVLNNLFHVSILIFKFKIIRGEMY